MFSMAKSQVDESLIGLNVVAWVGCALLLPATDLSI
jgi:hypothetical protein